MGGLRFGLLLAALIVGAGDAQAQGVSPPRTAEDFIAILRPAQPERTRSLAPTTGGVGGGSGRVAPTAPLPGAPGSARVPDLEVLFAFNSAELTPEARQTLDGLGQALASSELMPFTFKIGGHTDAIGPRDYNLQLSHRRAEAVVGYLVERWRIDPNRLEARGYGMAQLVLPNDGGNARNRRVEVETVVPN